MLIKKICVLVALLFSTSMFGANEKTAIDCKEFLESANYNLMLLPGLKKITIENRYNAGYAIWLRGKLDGTTRINASYQGSTFYISIAGAKNQQGSCTNVGIFGDNFIIRKGV